MARVELCIGTHGGDMKTKTAMSVFNMDWSCHDWHGTGIDGYTVEKNRTLLVKEALKRNADWLLFVDSDVEVPVDALSNLMSHDVDICLGWYSRQNNFDGKTCLFPLEQPSYSECYYAGELKDMASNGQNLVEVKAGGLGCALIRASVFERISFPWFRYVVYHDGKAMGEDVFFCQRCREAGLKVYADPRVGCAHAFRYWEEP